MKKIIFGIFAHPDDEAFGPAGTLLLETKNGSDLHLIMLTAGEAGMNPDDAPDISKVRLEEWRRAGKLLGAKKMHYLGYKDGTLDNQSMIAIASQVEEIITDTISTYTEEVAVELITFDLTGLSGHIDHIVAARASCLAFYRLKQKDDRLTRLRLFCIPSTHYPSHGIEWIFKEPGRSESEIDEVIDARHLREDILAVMKAHSSQRADFERLIEIYGDDLGLNNFIVKT